MGIDSGKSSKVLYTQLADPNNLCDKYYTPFCTDDCVECIGFFMQHPVFWEHMLYAPEKESNGAEEHIY